MKRFGLFIAFLLTTLIPSDTKVFAQDDTSNSFSTQYQVQYKIQEDGSTEVIHYVSITNLKSDLIVSSYSILIRQSEITNISGTSKDRKVDITKTTEGDMTKLTARFNDFIIGEGKQNNLTIKYNTKNITSKIGKVWTINIPKVQLTNGIEKYDVSLIVPQILGGKLYISPIPLSETMDETTRTYTFNKEMISNKGITASFGSFQDINYRLRYQLENKNSLRNIYEIALPPEMPGVQQIRYSSIRPYPKYIKQDIDGNTILGYQLKPNEQYEIEVIGNARISSRQIEPSKGGSFSSIPNQYKKYLIATKYWNVDSPIVKKLAKDLKDPKLNVTQNAQKVYEYILNNYKYDFEITKQTALERKGAEKALLDKSGWGCMEFTDLFISIVRAMGIPAKQLNGYALSTEQSTKPISVEINGVDKLHAWPEFYDPNLGWIQIDPTWGSTSGMDYFTKLDTNHFVFVQRGKDSELPLSAGEYRTNESEHLIEVVFSESTDNIDYSPEYKVEKSITINPIALLQNKRLFKITNTGKTVSL